MPAVKKKTGGRKKAPSVVSRIVALFQDYTVAGVAGSIVLLGLIALVMWAGGYFAMVGRAVDGAANRAAITAGLEVKRVTLRGAHQTAHDEIIEALGPVLGASIVHLSLGEARARIEELGWVRSAAVTRLLPDTISISVRERAPAAVWQLKGVLYLIDDSGAIIREVDAGEYANRPLIVGAGAPEAAGGVLKALAGKEELQKRIYALVRVGERRWDLRLHNEIEIRLPEENFESALADLELLQAAQQTLDQPIKYIDLRDPERMVVKKRDEPVSAPDGESP